ncbi:MAG: prepilin-type N-terminal cleavage/methylation domain-containing protein [Rhodoferax sp.]
MRARGFTLVELLVALAVLALMTALGWRGIDGMVRARAQVQQRDDAVLTLQAGLSQWGADLDALVELPQTPALDWDGRALRIVRRNTMLPGDGVLVVAWSRRNADGVGQWLRWQSPPVSSRGDLQLAWQRAAQWAQNPVEEERKLEVRVAALEQWSVYYYRGDAWTNPLSSDGASGLAASALPDGVRLVLTLPSGETLGGKLTRDWMRATLGGKP